MEKYVFFHRDTHIMYHILFFTCFYYTQDESASIILYVQLHAFLHMVKLLI